MSRNVLYIAVMALVSYTIRVLPLTLIRKPIRNTFIQSFLYYVPYVYARCDDLSSHPARNAVADFRRSCPDRRNHRRMARRRTVPGIRHLLRAGIS